MKVYITFAVFSIVLFTLFMTKQTIIGQLLSPAIPEPFGEMSEAPWAKYEAPWETSEDMRVWMSPY